MAKEFINRFTLVIFIGVLILGLLLRTNNLYTWPRLGATFDEYAWTWQGMNLIQKGIPESWSPHPQYKNAKSIIYRETHFRIVKPYLEHPPVFGLVVGGFALLNGADNMFDLTIYNIRPLAVVLGLLSIIMVYVLTSQLYDRKTGLIASLLYATIPTIVVGSRIVQNENFFIPFWLLALFLTVKFIKTKKGLFRNLAAIICGLLLLAKIPWIAAFGSIFLILLYLKKYKDLYKFSLIVLLFFIGYMFYGFYFDQNLFISLWGLQLNRYDLTFQSIYALFLKPYLVDRFYLDGWIYFGWFAFILVLLNDLKKNYVIIFALLSYFVIFLAGIPDEPSHGWYRYPFYPFLVISLALFIKDYFAKNYVLTFLFLVFVGTSLFGVTWEKAFGFSYVIFRVSLITWGLTLLPIFFPGKMPKFLSEKISYAWFSLFLVFNIWAVTLYNEQ